MGGTKFQVDNIRVDTYYDSRQFILHGVKGNDVVLTHFDFDRAYKQKCVFDYLQFLFTFLGGPNDMVTWSPHDEHGNCFMGKKYHYQRRKLGDECYYGQNFDFNKEKSSEPCPCTIFDYEWYEVAFNISHLQFPFIFN
jgi:hypothetical protein